jgi:glycosyl transferase family 25
LGWPHSAKNLIFMIKYKVYCISEKGSERYERAKKRINDLGLEFIHVPAVRATTMVDYDGTIRRRYWGCDLSLGEIGCFLAHRSAWQMILDNESSPVLVVEDDVGFKSGAYDAITGVINSMRVDDIVSLYSDWSRTCVRSHPVNENYRIGIPLSSGNTLVAYTIGPIAVKRLLDGARVISHPVDGYVARGWLHGARVLHCQPFPCLHDDGGKSLIGLRAKPSASGFGKIVRWCSRYYYSARKRAHTLRSLVYSTVKD